MMIEEFEQRTGFYPTMQQYAAIERAYMDFDGDKDAFCKAYKKNVDGMAERIQREVSMDILKQERDHAAELAQRDAEISRRDAEIERLKKELDRELEWKPTDGTGTNMNQERYEELLAICTGHNGDPHVMSEAEARQLVAEEFGFDPERIEIISTVHTYEVNRHHQLRKAATYTRQPLYDATDYNYVRFNVRCAGSTWMYEMVNGELETYSC